MKKRIASALVALSMACLGAMPAYAHDDDGDGWHGHHHRRGAYEPKVMIITMFGPEAEIPWLSNLGPWKEIAVPGLSPDYKTVHCNRARVCVMTTGMGHANAAASTMALVFSREFDTSRTYFLIAGIAGINPKLGTVGSVGWARWLVDFGIQWEIDSRELTELPPGWSADEGGYLGINTKKPSDKPPLDYRTEVFQLNEALLQKAYGLSKSVVLSDGPQAQAARLKFNNARDVVRYAPASQPPSVLQCDTMAGDTWFSGTALGERAEKWTQILTDGKGVYCTTQQEDNATYEALKRGAAAGRADLNRIAVLRAGSDFDRPADGQSSVDNLVNYQDQGGFIISLQNLYRAGNPLVQEISRNWSSWKNGVPE